MAQISIKIKSRDGVKRIVDNRMRNHGDFDPERKVIRVNKSRKMNKRRGEVIDTIVHEEMHRAHPKMRERTVRKKTKKKVRKLSVGQKQRFYNKFKK